MIRCRKPYIYCPFYGEFGPTKIETLAIVFSSPPRWCAIANSTILEGSPKTDAHAGALGLAGGSPEPAAIDAELAPSRLVVASRHRRPQPSQGE
jgi:hypothetical protein